jgi:hypothetical protein
MHFIKTSILSALALTGHVMTASAISEDIYSYPECDNTTLSSHGIGGAALENSVVWRHPGGVSSIFSNDLNDILCRVPTAVVDELKAEHVETVKRDCPDCGKSCLGRPCLSGAMCNNEGCVQGCMVRWECAPQNCPGQITNCI